MKVALWLPKYNVPIDDPCCYPLGFMYISAVLKRAGHDVVVFNNNLWPHSILALLKFDVVCLTGFDEFYHENTSVLAFCKRHNIHTVLGGAMATFGKLTADATIIGEGEESILAAIHSPGIFKSPVDINTLPWPDYEGFNINEYHRRHSNARYMGVLTSRGCPHNCTFCAHTCRFACRRLDDVFAEIDTYKTKYRLDMVVVNDNTLNASTGRFRQFCEGMLRKGLGWSAAIRLDNLDENLVQLAKASGLVYAVVGVESFKQEKLDAMNKKITVSQIEKGLDLLEKYHIGYHGNIILGFEGETNAEIAQEYADMKRRGYRTFPVLLQSFSGIAATADSTIDRKAFSAEFSEYIHSNGMYTYPEV